MEKDTFWSRGTSIALIIIGIITIYLMLYPPSRLPKTQPQERWLSLVKEGQPYIDDVITKDFIRQPDDMISMELLTQIPKTEFRPGDKIQFTLNINNRKKDASLRLRTLFIDPLGRIVLENPERVSKNLSGNEGIVNTSTQTKIYFIIPNESRYVVDGSWTIDVILLNKENKIVSEVALPLEVRAFRDSLWKSNFWSIIIVIVSFIIGFILAIREMIFRRRIKEVQRKILAIPYKEIKKK